MIKSVIRLVKPGLFLPFFIPEVHNESKILVRPKYLSICAADQRYFCGDRPPSVMEKKLPLALIHEGIGEILSDPSGNFAIGQQVVMLPCGTDNTCGANYQTNAFFRSSTTDGFCQETLYLNKEELLPIPQDATYLQLYVFTELLSVCCHALNRTQKLGMKEHSRIGIWGDGVMGQTLAMVIHALEPSMEIIVFGRHDDKLMLFTRVTDKVNILDSSKKINVDIAFECVGGDKSEFALKQIINCIYPCGKIILMGVSERPPRVPTRAILEKGLTLVGTSRSQRNDFEQAISLINLEYFRVSLCKLVSGTVEVRNSHELNEAFVYDTKQAFKTLIEFNI